LEQNITSYASSNNLSNSSIKIGNEKLKFANTRVPEPITFKYLEKTLGEVIKNESQVKLIIEHIKQKRNIKIVPEIKRFSNN
jgi:dihydroorotase